jgi:predicted RNase H-related nuclease YkuK (DUF458 family)
MQKYNEEVVKNEIRNSSLSTAVYVGCDSRRFKRNGTFYAVYTTVVVLHIDQCRGCKIYGFRKIKPDFGNIRERMLTEVEYAVTVGYELLDVIENRRFEIHIDVNPDPRHKSHAAVKEALGYVIGMGLVPRIKPQAPIASTAADHFGKRKVSNV